MQVALPEGGYEGAPCVQATPGLHLWPFRFLSGWSLMNTFLKSCFPYEYNMGMSSLHFKGLLWALSEKVIQSSMSRKHTFDIHILEWEALWDLIQYMRPFGLKWSCSVMSNSLQSMDCSLPGSSVHGIFQARVRELTILLSCFPKTPTPTTCKL